jgi:peptidoglycan L-alanyl-D-glutamate endopeptidase CwlK
MSDALFTEKSLAELATVHADLRRVVMRARSWSRIPFEASQGARTIEQQRQYFQEGKSKVNPDAYATPEALYRAAKHVVGPGAPLSRAVDLFVPGQPDGAYDKNALSYLAGVMEAAAQSLGVSIRWGGDFDGDGILLEKGTFHDLPHFELNI